MTGTAPHQPSCAPDRGEGAFAPRQAGMCGAIAREALLAARQARVMGITSRGVFLLLDNGWVIFISGEAHRGPLTLNLGRDIGRLGRLEAGAPVRVEPPRLVFPTVDQGLDWGDVPAWTAPAAAASALPAGELRQRGQALARRAHHFGRRSPVIDLLPEAWGLNETAAARLLPGYLRARAAWQCGDEPGLAAALGEFVGLGSGLTPSGDDLILGFVLALGRWGGLTGCSWSPEQQQALCAGLVERVRQGSSALCGCLAACAARGQADERLVLALDGLVTGQVTLEACASALAGWGNSSGFDALVGMGLMLGGCT